MKEKIIKGIVLAVLGFVVGYLIFQKVSTAGVLALIMFMSMFVKKKDY